MGNKKLYAGLALCALAIFYARWELFRYYEARESLAGYADRTAVVEGTVADDPDKRATSLRVALRVSAVNGQELPAAAQGQMLVLLPRETSAAYGDTLKVRGLIGLPESFETNTGRVFDYPGYLRVRGISAVMQRATLREDAPAGWSMLGMLYSVKHRFEASLEQVIPEPEASLLEGMLLGERGGFSQELLQAFIIVGLIHIVVLSGSNISIVAEAVFRFLGLIPRLPRKYLYLIGFAAIILFALMVGGGAATLRAVVMGAIAILARYLRRPQAALRALAVAAVAMALWNPLVVLYDNGFLLSFLATFGLITLSPAIEKRLGWLPTWERFNLRSIVASTVAVEVFILPALLYTSGVLSYVSIPINALVLPLVPVAMLLGFVSGCLGLVHPWLALVPALLTQLVLKIILLITQGAAAMPFASTIVTPFPWWMAALCYVPLTWTALSAYTKSSLASRT